MSYLENTCILKSQLKEKCKESLKLKSLYTNYLDAEKKIIEKYLQYVNLPDYTDHGHTHIFNVQENLSRIIPNKKNNVLSVYEIYLLLLSALLHDIGMLITKEINESSSQIRIDHFNRSRDFIIQHGMEFNLSKHESMIVGEICRAHGMPNLDYLNGIVFSIKSYGEVRVPLLSALLRLADILDLTSDRAPSYISDNRKMLPTNRKHWNVHQCISDVQIVCEPSWDINIISFPKNQKDEINLLQLKNIIQNELDIIYPILRSAGIFYRKIEIVLNNIITEKTRSKHKNPFILLSAFKEKQSSLFAGRDNEIQKMIELILGRNIVILIGESGVGKTSLVEGGIIPQLKEYQYKIIRFSFQEDPIQNLISTIKRLLNSTKQNMSLVDAIKEYQNTLQKNTRILFIGDHLEQMFTINTNRNHINTMEMFSRLLNSNNPITFLFCIREDYLPDLYNLSQYLPDLYNKNNTFKLHRLNSENGIEVFQKASNYASKRMSIELIKAIVDELCKEGDGLIYPPYLQIVGHRVYSSFYKQYNNEDIYIEIPLAVFENLGGVSKIVNNYLDGILDQYPQEDKAIIGQILNTMVTEYYTKKRIKKEELLRMFPLCQNLEKILSSLVKHRIVKRSLGEYELIHDFLVRKIIDIIEKKNYISYPVRKALEYINQDYNNSDLSSRQIAKYAGVTQIHLASLFKKQLGITINKQLNITRITKSKEYIVENGLATITDIALNNGFRSLNSFSRKFKEIEGISPMEFRNINLKNNISE